MIASKRGMRPWKVGLGIYIFQMVLLIFLCLAILAPGENFIADQLPLKVKIDVTSCAQFFLVLFGIFFLQNDLLVELARNLSVLHEDDGTTLRNLVGGYDDDFEKVKARFLYVNVMIFTIAVVTVTVTVYLTVISSDTFNLLRDFAALTAGCFTL